MSQGSLMKSFIGFLMGPVVGAAIGFFTTIVTTWILNPEEIGKSSSVTVFMTITTLFIYFGLDQAFIREFNESKDKKQLFWTSLKFPLMLSMIISIVSVGFSRELSIILFNEVNLYGVILILLMIPFTTIDRYSMLILRMEEKAKLYSFIQIINKILNLILLVFYLLCINRSYTSIVFAMSISNILTALIGVYYTKDYWINRHKTNKQLLFKLIRYGIPLVPTMILTSLFNSMDRIALLKWSDFNEVGIYTVLFKITMVISIIQAAFSSFWTPVSQRWYSEKVSNEKIIEIGYIMCSVVSILYILLMIFKDVIVSLLLPVDYREFSLIIPLLAYVPLMSILSLTTCVGINYSRRTELNIVPALIALGANYFGNKILVPNLGAVGASISSAISYTIFFIVITYLSRRVWFKFKISNFVINIGITIVVSLNGIFINNTIITIICFFIVIFYNMKYYKILLD
ncbi:MAG: oligosaccharide flippase family protein, partial [Clostridium sp.]|uniref:lipopolysaccharide biosynthesis protein n=1 Tax=Clostridium sp. TaxID=1506 RepID=UPI00290B967F